LAASVCAAVHLATVKSVGRCGMAFFLRSSLRPRSISDRANASPSPSAPVCAPTARRIAPDSTSTKPLLSVATGRTEVGVVGFIVVQASIPIGFAL